MKDLPIECLDQEAFETGKATPFFEATVMTIAALKSRATTKMVDTIKCITDPSPTSIAWTGGYFYALDEILSLITGETRDAEDTNKEP